VAMSNHQVGSPTCNEVMVFQKFEIILVCIRGLLQLLPAAAAGEAVSGELTARGKIKIMKFIIVSLGVGGLGECWAATPG
jgi:hypothetical protein